MRARETSLPIYSKNQELWNTLSHAIGIIFTVILMPFFVMKSMESGDAFRIVSSIIFLVSLFVLYCGSTLYHGWKPSKTKSVLRVLDHSNIYLLIVGTYAPYSLIALRSYSNALGWSIFAIELALGLIGLTLNFINLERFKIISMIDYILMGWLIIGSFIPLTRAIGFMPGTFLLLLGGISYTVGAIFYGIGAKKTQWMHLVFHIFCLVGTALMAFSIYFCVL